MGRMLSLPSKYWKNRNCLSVKPAGNLLIYYILHTHNGAVISFTDDDSFFGVGSMDDLSITDINRYMSTGFPVGGIADDISRLDFTVLYFCTIGR